MEAGSAPRLSGLEVADEDLGDQMGRALSSPADPAAALSRALSPILSELAGPDWSLTVEDGTFFGCDAESRLIIVGTGLFAELGPQRQGKLLANGFLHELGHALYTNAVPSIEDDVHYVSHHPSNQVERLNADRYWLDNVFTDARLAAAMIREHPTYAALVEIDRRMQIEKILHAYAQISGSQEHRDDPLALFPSLSQGEQTGLLMMARLHAQQTLEREWRKSADSRSLEALEQMAAALDLVRDGRGREYITELGPCVHVLAGMQLEPDLQIRPYKLLMDKYQPELHPVESEHMAKIVRALEREPDFAALDLSGGLSAEQLDRLDAIATTASPVDAYERVLASLTDSPTVSASAF